MGCTADGTDHQVDPAEHVEGPLGEHRHGPVGVHRPDHADHAEPLGPHGLLGRGHPTGVVSVDHHGGAAPGEP